MSDLPEGIPVDPMSRPGAVAMEWTKPENWSSDGNDWLGSTPPPWGRATRCPNKAQGRRCRKSCIPGGTTCKAHGGGAPQVKRRAQIRLLSLVDPAIGQLARILVTSPDDRLRAAVANSILDRAGVSKSPEMDAEAAKAIMMGRYYALQAEAAQAAEQAGEDAALGELTAEVIQDAEEVVDAPLDDSEADYFFVEPTPVPTTDLPSIVSTDPVVPTQESEL
jgi:hypothetical protein